VDQPDCTFIFQKTLIFQKALIFQMAHNSFPANKMRCPVPLVFAQNIIECNSSQSTTELPIVVIDSANGNVDITRGEGPTGSTKSNAEGGRLTTEDTPMREYPVTLRM
jgi:hypothetical protein